MTLYRTTSNQIVTGHRADTVEAYEDNAGGLNLYAYSDGEVVWSCHYYGNEDEAAADFAGIAEQGLDPVAEGWESDDLDLDGELGDLFASSDWYSGLDGSMFSVEHSGAAAQRMARLYLGEYDE